MNRKTIQTLLALAILGIAYLFGYRTDVDTNAGSGPLPPRSETRAPSSRGSEASTREDVARAFRERRSGVMVDFGGRVDRVLSDDNEGSRHQRFTIRLDRERSILISHNIDLAPRVPLSKGDDVTLRGQYEFDARGGVIHWTHHDPAKRHPEGWIRHRGKLYQ